VPHINPPTAKLNQAAGPADGQQRAPAAAAASQAEPGATPSPTATGPAPTAAAVSSYVVQFASPDAGAVDVTLAAVRGTAGVRGAAATSLAIGGTSVMSVSFAGSIDDLAAALKARGFTVRQGGNALAISR
jgi:hypothetical protein